MARVEHYKARDVARLCNEYEREPEYKCRDGRIDPKRTHLNYTMEPRRIHHQLAYDLPRRVDKIPHIERKDLNVMSTWIVTLPEGLKDANDATKQRFFVVAYKYTQDRYGKDNVINGYVHMDETTPHIHIPTVPVCDGRISSKALYTRKELHDYQEGLEAVMQAEFGMSGLILNGRTKGNYTVDELKARKRDEADISRRHADADEYMAKVEDAAKALDDVLGEGWTDMPASRKKSRDDAFEQFTATYPVPVYTGNGNVRQMTIDQIEEVLRREYAKKLAKQRDDVTKARQAVAQAKQAQTAESDDDKRQRMLYGTHVDLDPSRRVAMPDLSGSGGSNGNSYNL